MEKPPSRINGKPNPEYKKWYNQSNKGKAAQEKYRKTLSHRTKLIRSQNQEGRPSRQSYADRIMESLDHNAFLNDDGEPEDLY